MDGSTFDRLTRAVSAARSRRHLLGVLAGLGLGGVLSALNDDATEARRKRQGRRRHGRNRGHRPGKDKDNRKGERTGNGGNQDRDEPAPCRNTGELCEQDSDCCTNNCFNFACADLVPQCSQGGATTSCRPPAKGCAGAQCCHGPLSCDEGCCQPPANQCNSAGKCCVPNCAGRQCGDDGCGQGETCGTCPTNATCNSAGQCQSSCTPQCQGKQCGPDGCGGTCGACATGRTCQDGQCVPTCTPSCTGKTCGDDGCGGTCGSCVPDDQACCGGQCLFIVGDPSNCGACGHQCQGPTLCQDGKCCVEDAGLPGTCSATVPCCIGQCRPDGSCCLSSGRSCNGHNELCCSGQCGSNGDCV